MLYDINIMPRWLSLVERETCNLVVAGSIPVRGFNLYFTIQFFFKNVEEYSNIYILWNIDYH